MMDSTLIPWLLAGIPLLGVLACLPFQSDPERRVGRRVGLEQPGLVVVFAGRVDVPPEGLLPLYPAVGCDDFDLGTAGS